MDDRGISAFNRLSREQAENLAGMFDEDLLLHCPDLERMRKITGQSFSGKDLARLYLDLLMILISVAARRGVESAVGMDDDRRALLAGIAEKMRGAINAGKIEDSLALGGIRRLGRPRAVRLGVYTEFRPLSENGEIRRVAPHLVVDGTVRTGTGATRQPIKLQMDRATARHTAKELQSQIDALGDEIAGMRSKFGGDVVLD